MVQDDSDLPVGALTVVADIDANEVLLLGRLDVQAIPQSGKVSFALPPARAYELAAELRRALHRLGPS